jgi:hypothetical protein
MVPDVACSLTDGFQVTTIRRSICMTRAAYFLGGVLTGILGVAAAACISSHMEDRRWHERMLRESALSGTDCPVEAPESAETRESEEPDTNAMQTA